MENISLSSVYKLDFSKLLVVILLTWFNSTCFAAIIDITPNDIKKWENNPERYGTEYILDVTNYSMHTPGVISDDRHGKFVVKTLGEYHMHEVLGSWKNSEGRDSNPRSLSTTGNGNPRYYFEVKEPGFVDIKLITQRESQNCPISVTDTYLYLLNMNGGISAENDDYNNYSFINNFFTDPKVSISDDWYFVYNSLCPTESGISKYLETGYYIIEAATYSANIKGDFALSIGSNEDVATNFSINAPSQLKKIQAPLQLKKIQGEWVQSTGREIDGNPQYTFKLKKDETVTISITSDDVLDTYLFLLDKNGKVIAAKDDEALNKKHPTIIKELSAGEYSVVAATFKDSEAGKFDLTLESFYGTAFQPKDINKGYEELVFENCADCLQVQNEEIIGLPFSLATYKVRVNGQEGETIIFNSSDNDIATISKDGDIHLQKKILISENGETLTVAPWQDKLTVIKATRLSDRATIRFSLKVNNGYQKIQYELPSYLHSSKVEKNGMTSFKIHSTAFMSTTSIFKLKASVEESEENYKKGIGERGVGTNKLKYRSSNSSVAIINSDSNSGFVRIVGAGKAIITIETNPSRWAENSLRELNESSDHKGLYYTQAYNTAQEKFELEVEQLNGKVESIYSQSGWENGKYIDVEFNGDGIIDFNKLFKYEYYSSDGKKLNLDRREGELYLTVVRKNIAQGSKNGLIRLKEVGMTFVDFHRPRFGIYGAIKGTFTLNVKKGKQDFKFADSKSTKNYGDEAFFLPEIKNISDSSENWTKPEYKIHDPSIARVDKNGNVTIKGIGTTIITATRPANEKFEKAVATLTLTVKKGKQEIEVTELEDNKIDRLYGGTPFKIKVSKKKDVDWAEPKYKIHDSSIARVDKNGNVTIKGIGTTIITATRPANEKFEKAVATFTLTVKKGKQEIEVTELEDNKIDRLYGGTPFKIKVSKKKDVDWAEPKYKIHDPSIARVDEYGNVTIKRLGTTIITATRPANAKFEEAKDTFTLTVKRGKQEIEFTELEDNKIDKFYGDDPFQIKVSKKKDVDWSELKYKSANSSIASVDEHGKVTIKGSGTAIITATRAANAKFEKAETTFTVDIEKASIDFHFKSSFVKKNTGDKLFDLSEYIKPIDLKSINKNV